MSFGALNCTSTKYIGDFFLKMNSPKNPFGDVVHHHIEQMLVVFLRKMNSPQTPFGEIYITILTKCVVVFLLKMKVLKLHLVALHAEQMRSRFPSENK